jgi:transposase
VLGFEVDIHRTFGSVTAISHDPQTASLTPTFDPDKHAKAERLDGCYLLKTNRKDLSGDELWRIYALLTRAEAAFRDLKSPLSERPIFHHLEHRVEAHIFLCVLATTFSSPSRKPFLTRVSTHPGPRCAIL